MIELRGDIVANKIKEDLKERIESTGLRPKLAIISCGYDPASEVYVRNKLRACTQIGIRTELIQFPEDVTNKEVLDVIDRLNNDDSVNGILLQLPVPPQLYEGMLQEEINLMKDVDGTHPYNLGNLMLWWKGEINNVCIRPTPCTAIGVMHLLEEYDIDVAGKHVVIIGRSNIVGKPLGLMMLRGDATVTYAHSKTQNLQQICKEADILVVAVGKPKMITKEYIKEGAVVVDVGINRTDDGLVGDVDYEGVKDIVSAITPVPRGVGPMTVAELLVNVVNAAI